MIVESLAAFWALINFYIRNTKHAVVNTKFHRLTATAYVAAATDWTCLDRFHDSIGGLGRHKKIIRFETFVIHKFALGVNHQSAGSRRDDNMQIFFA